jgi:NADH-quinone oxidoreductase subunit M
VSLQKLVGLGVTLATFVVSLGLVKGFNDVASYQFEERVSWIPAWGISYHVGIDGLSLWLVILTTFLTPLCLLGSWTQIESRVREFVLFMLLLEAGMIRRVRGARPLPVLRVLGGDADPDVLPDRDLGPRPPHLRRGQVLPLHVRRQRADARRVPGALQEHGLLDVRHPQARRDARRPGAADVAVPGVRARLAIKVPMWPFHTWLPDAHVEAPTAGSVILAGVLLKMGGYGFLRLAIPLFPDAAVRLAPLVGVLAVIGVVYGALVSLVQPDLKKLVAYSSVSHLGFVMLGIAGLSRSA